ncbi:hypothetical protein SO802_005345 [Lithocarpus litseifolius]|uniref:Protein kinase domain-containing protein n=1 Tax=Lithocarpus litseifolius TaxID=425828 RepID=A0AAW2DHX4_9ROSI
MGMCSHFISALLGGMALTLLVHAKDQLGFISIDCGSRANYSYTEPRTGINYISDATFTDTGISNSISTELNKDDYQLQQWTLRSFPDGIRNCYRINVTQEVKYLIRATFLYGNYDGQGNFPIFDLHLGPNMWDSVEIVNAPVTVYKELIHVPSLNYIHVCLVNKGHGTPFISAIELRPLNDKVYGAGDDIYDRIWEPDNFYEGIVTELSIDSKSHNDYQPPSVVMSTAATPKTDSSPLNFSWDSETATSEYYIYMHFAEVVKLKANQSRSFKITINGNPFYGPYVPMYLYTETLFSPSALTIANNYEVSIFKTENSTLPPILNAVEIYSVKNLSQSETDQQDVDAITKIKSTYGVKKNWQGDPCVPQTYLWEGLNCSYDGYNSPRIISLDLSSSGLTGEISADISNLVMLQDLDLSDNSLTGSILYSLSQLKYLRVLNLERNQLNGSIPAELIKRSNSGSLLLSVGENSNLCASDSCERKKTKKNILVLTLASVVGFLILSLTIAAIFCGLTRKKQDKTRVALVDTEPNVQNRPLESMQRQVTYSDLQRITNNFERILGKGGFGTVYYGCIDGIHVAVKVKLLMRVHHKNLTTLVGYCYEGTNMGLVYEYMANRDLEAQLSGRKTNILSWQARLQIAIDAAEGLEYLHHGCKPPIIHRDVKTTNILLNEKFNAKLGDFGLSKIFQIDSGTHVSTNVVGTPGYLDPEYYKSNRLNEKSDVYSFGVVLLKIITNRPVIERSQERTHISQWVSFMLAKGDIQNIVDPRLGGDFNVNSVWKAVEVAVVCVSPTSGRRPTMSQVVAELKESLTTELSQKIEGYGVELKDSFEMINMDLSTELNPLAR